MSKNTNWFGFEAAYSDIYPKAVIELAEAAGVSPEKVAERDGIKAGGTLFTWISRDQLECLFRIEQHKYEPDYTLLYFETGDVEIVAENNKRLTRRIDNFLKSVPNYNMVSDDSFPPPTAQEIREMNEEEDNND